MKPYQSIHQLIFVWKEKITIKSISLSDVENCMHCSQLDLESFVWGTSVRSDEHI